MTRAFPELNLLSGIVADVAVDCSRSSVGREHGWAPCPRWFFRQIALQQWWRDRGDELLFTSLQLIIRQKYSIGEWIPPELDKKCSWTHARIFHYGCQPLSSAAGITHMPWRTGTPLTISSPRFIFHSAFSVFKQHSLQLALFCLEGFSI